MPTPTCVLQKEILFYSNFIHISYALDFHTYTAWVFTLHGFANAGQLKGCHLLVAMGELGEG